MHVALRPRYVVALLLPILVPAAPVRAADAPPGLPGVRAAVDVTAMDLDVVATTRDGRPVSDLTRAEISVTVDGQPFPLDYFVKVEAGQLHGPDLTTASPDLILETAAAGADRYVSRQFLVFFDDEHLMPFDRKRVIEGLRDFVTRLSPSDNMAIVSYNISTHVLVPFTSSLSQFDYSVTPEFQAVIAEANRSGITVHALDARSLATDVDASESAPSPVAGFSADANRREALAGLADETGGILVQNRNFFSGALEGSTGRQRATTPSASLSRRSTRRRPTTRSGSHRRAPA
jgi:hypothetical protein